MLDLFSVLCLYAVLYCLYTVPYFESLNRYFLTIQMIKAGPTLTKEWRLIQNIYSHI